MNQFEFDKLLEKYLAGQTTPAEEDLVRQWSDQVLAASSTPLAPAEGETIRKRIWQRLRRGVLGSRRLPEWPRWAKLGVAASVGIALVGTLYAYKGAFLFGPLHPERTPPPGAIRVHNTSGKPQRVTLKDGSTVVLAPRSSISYPEHFGDKTRTIFLQGEACFDVRKDPNKPFIVQAGELMTQVLGTRFTVKSYEEAETIEVVVAAGKVSVYGNREKSARHRDGVILTPNQKITFDKKSQKLTPGLVETPAVVPAPGRPAKHDFVFAEVPLSQVLATLKETYGIDILVENDAMNVCRFTADLNNLSLYTQLDLIC
ncbi:MAG: FecR domain-containing protein, partial [Cytophagales bacterium]|nr:FecR domain-containing protein [Cytophagales bacterium]